ncbi:MAG: TRAP transporter permease, partial [Desulfotignum sp.]|nr:TRAP transporter permease [Desulfotignum sp.]
MTDLDMSEKQVNPDEKYPPAGQNPTLVTFTARVVMAIAVGLSLYQLYTAGVVALTALVQRSIHLGAILALVFLTRSAFAGVKKNKLSVWVVLDWMLAGLSIYCTYYICGNLSDIFDRQGDWLFQDRVVSIMGVLLVLEACRRVIGVFMTGICALSIVYAMFGPYMPELIIHKGYSIERIATTLWLTTEGIFGLPIGVAATFVFVFVLFGAILETTGGGAFFIDMAYALTGRFSGGPAKASVVASGFMGSVSGSAVGNVAATGSFTIPMMKKVGYRPHMAGAIEAAASTGGQLMPPIMGAGAFLMAEFTNTSYLTIIKVALVPAIMYYVTVLVFVHYEARKFGLKGQPKESLPKIGSVIKNGLHFIIPVLILIYVLMANYSPMMAGFIAVVSTLGISILVNFIRWIITTENRQRLSGFAAKEGGLLVKALENGAKNAVMVSVACAAAGIIVGMVSLTGMGLKFSSLVMELSFGIKTLAILLIAVASLVLGMGLPVTASYIVLATLAGPALMDMGVPVLVAHMIVFWYSQDSNVTPPVSLASFAGAAIAKASPMRTAFASWKLAKGLYIIPLVMAYRPLLGMGDNY